jgi:hypothetical protein
MPERREAPRDGTKFAEEEEILTSTVTELL